MPEAPADLVLDTPFDTALGDRYLVYALSTITARSLPDLRDGLKPVHRRILWGMRLLGLGPALRDDLAPTSSNVAYKKSARVVGDVMGKYHPHGDQSIYDALVRLSQDFALRYPLVDGQGNFGNIDGDNAAAMRYTEARLTAAAAELMAGLDEEAVPFRTTYNGEEEEPEVFPGLFPNLLANGSSGIAVGMATSIPPHNAAEVLDAALALLVDPDADPMAYVRGPDFPTGGVCVEPAASIAESYATGRGSFRLRANWRKVDEKGGTWHIDVFEIPYQVVKGKLIADLAELVTEKKLPILGDVDDHSDAQVRIIIEPRSRNVDPFQLMESLFRLTDLEVRVSLNMNVLDHGRPRRAVAQTGHRQMAGAYPRGAAGTVALPARQDRRAAGGACRAAQGLSQPRRGHPHHPRGRRRQGRPDRRLRPDRGAGRGDPQHAAAVAAETGRNRDHARKWRAVEGGHRPPQSDRIAEAPDRPADRRPDCIARALRPRHPARRTADADRGGARCEVPVLGIDDRPRAADHHRLGQGLGAGDEGPCRSGAGRGDQVQGGRRPGARLPRPHHRQDHGRGVGRAFLHIETPTSCPAAAVSASRCG